MDINSNNNDALLLQFGAHNAGVIPVPIPNTEVKPSSADYTAMRETRKVPNYQETTRKGGFLISRVITGTLLRLEMRCSLSARLVRFAPLLLLPCTVPVLTRLVVW